MADDNKPLKYMRYAIGEIILVVIGILIALYINNWNEQRKEQEKFDQTLVEVQKELINNLRGVRGSLEWYGLKDSILLKILIDTLMIEEYYDENNQGDLFYQGFNFTPLRLSNDSFKRLTQFNNINAQQDSILQQLKDLDLKSNKIVDEFYNWMINTVKENRKLIQKYNWFNDWTFGRYDNHEVLNYFVNDPEYVNIASDYFTVVHTYRGHLETYDKDGLSIYHKIHDYLKRQNLQLTDSLYFEYNPNRFKHYLGKYESVWSSDKNYVHDDSIVISLEEDKLIYTGYRSDGPDTRFEIIPVDKYLFRTERGGFYHLSLDDEGEVKNIRFSVGPGFILDMKKVR